jgi:hypothetical protein
VGLGGIPSALQTLLAFAAFVVPGFLLRAGYVRSRAVSANHPALYVLAEAVTGSLAVLAVAWWWRGEEVLGWVQAGTLYKNREDAYSFFAVLLAMPYPTGVMAGWLVNTLSNVYDSLRPGEDTRGFRHRLFYWLEVGGVFNGPTLWDDVWEDVGRRAPLLIKVTTTAGREVAGVIEFGTWAANSPQPRELFLRHVYSQDSNGDWQVVPNSEGMFFHESAIESLEFLGPIPTGEEVVPRHEGPGHDPDRSLAGPLTALVLCLVAGKVLGRHARVRGSAS